MNLPHSLDRSVSIRARRATVFSFFTDSARFAAWWGQGSTIDARPGGAVVIRYPNGVVARGEVVEVAAPEHIVFTFGYETGRPIAIGSSRVTISLREDAAGTVVELRHDFAEAEPRDLHVPGWRYQLAVFANVAADVAHAAAERTVDAYFAAWAETEAARRAQQLREICAESVAHRDRHAALAGIDDLDGHIAASQRFFPGVALRRRGPVRHCQGTALVDWTMATGDGREVGAGANVFDFTPDGRIAAVTGFAG